MVKTGSGTPFLLVALAGSMAILAGAYLLFSVDFDFAAAKAMTLDRVDRLSEIHPLILFAAIALLPLIGFPVSPLLVAAGVAYDHATGLMIGISGMAVNDALGYWLASTVLRERVESFVEKRGWRIPVINEANTIKIVTIFRLTPGFPLPAQTYLLGLAKVPFFTYMWVSVLAQCIPVAGFVLTSGSIFEGSWGIVFIGVSLLVVMAIAARMITNHYGKSITRSDTAEP